MKKNLSLPLLFAATFFLSGCSFPSSISTSSNSTANATFLRSDDDSASWNSKIKIDDKKNIAGIDVLTMAVNPTDPDVVYLGTASNGLYMSKDGGETWTQVPFADKAYGLVFDPQDPNVMYGSGVFNNRAKIYKRTQEGQQWKEIYTEPADGTTISALAISKVNSQVLYAGTSDGVIIKSTDGGQTWVNLKIDTNSGAPITSIVFDAVNDRHVLFASFGQGVLETEDGGASIHDITNQIDTVGNTVNVYTLVADQNLPGTFYAGTGNGIFRRTPDGAWKPINLIESSKAFPIRALAINPHNPREIIYAASKAIYKSTDGGQTWATFQLDTTKDISVLRYNQNDPTKIYAGLRSF